MTRYLNFFSACAVTVVIFGHLNRSSYLSCFEGEFKVKVAARSDVKSLGPHISGSTVDLKLKLRVGGYDGRLIAERWCPSCFWRSRGQGQGRFKGTCKEFGIPYFWNYSRSKVETLHEVETLRVGTVRWEAETMNNNLTHKCSPEGATMNIILQYPLVAFIPISGCCWSCAEDTSNKGTLIVKQKPIITVQ